MTDDSAKTPMPENSDASENSDAMPSEPGSLESEALESSEQEIQETELSSEDGSDSSSVTSSNENAASQAVAAEAAQENAESLEPDTTQMDASDDAEQSDIEASIAATDEESSKDSDEEAPVSVASGEEITPAYSELIDEALATKQAVQPDQSVSTPVGVDGEASVAASDETLSEDSEEPEVPASAAFEMEETTAEDGEEVTDEVLEENEAIQINEPVSMPAAESDDSVSGPEVQQEKAEETLDPVPEPTPSAAAQSSSGILDNVLAAMKGVSVWVLKTLMKALNWAVIKLENAKTRSEKREKLPSDGEWIERLWVTVQPLALFVSLTTTRSLNSVLTWILRKLDADAIPTSTPKMESEVSSTTLLTNFSKAATRTLTPILKQLWRLWLRLLAVLRDRLFPDSLKTLSDITLTTFAAILLVGFLWLTSAITSGGSPSVAQEMPTKPSSPAGSAPAASTRAKSPPSKKRLVEIQNQVSELTDDYAEGMVKAVQVSFGSERLIVNLGNDWYRLDEAQQNRLAQDILSRTKQLDFSKLDIFDQDDIRIGRNPVVGDDMIIFSRTKELPPDEVPEIESVESNPLNSSGLETLDQSDVSDVKSANETTLNEFEETSTLADDLADDND